MTSTLGLEASIIHYLRLGHNAIFSDPSVRCTQGHLNRVVFYPEKSFRINLPSIMDPEIVHYLQGTVSDTGVKNGRIMNFISSDMLIINAL